MAYYDGLADNHFLLRNCIQKEVEQLMGMIQMMERDRDFYEHMPRGKAARDTLVIVYELHRNSMKRLEAVDKLDVPSPFVSFGILWFLE